MTAHQDNWATRLTVDREQLGEPEAVQLFEQAGVLQVRNFLDEDKVATLARAVEEAQATQTQALVVGTGRRMLPVPIAGVFDDPAIYASEKLMQFLGQLHGQGFVLNCFTCINSEPGAQDQHIHRDYGGLFADKIDTFCPSFAINLLVPLAPFNPVNGTTRVWPGSHRKPDLSDDPMEKGHFDPELPLGSALLVDYRLKHCGTANHSAAHRPALCLGYSRDWFLDTLHYKDINPLQLDKRELEKKPEFERHLLSRTTMYAALEGPSLD